MSWLAISGIDLSALAATISDPKGDRRDIGEQAQANDGSTRVTRQTRKYDISFQSVPLKSVDAFAWESLIVGEGHVWNFELSMYSSKGFPGAGSDGTVIRQGSVFKFGTAALKIPTGKTWETQGLSIDSTKATFAVWCRIDSGSWHHYVIESADGSKLWIDGVLSPGSAHPFDTDGSPTACDVVLQPPSAGTNFYFDDFIICPYLWPSTWPALVFANNAAFSPLPYLTCAGDLVPEASTRSMVGVCSVAKVLRANPTGVSGGAAKTVQVLQVDLKGV